MKHTPGPWKVDQRVGCIAVYEDSKDFNCLDIDKSNFVAYWSGHLGHNGWELAAKDEANARLIAAAPELLRAVDMAIPSFEVRGEDSMDRLIALCRAYEKATGEKHPADRWTR